MHFAIIAILDYQDEEHRLPASYVQASGDKFEAVIEREFFGIRVIGRYDTCREAMRALMRNDKIENLLIEWNTSEVLPN